MRGHGSRRRANSPELQTREAGLNISEATSGATHVVMIAGRIDSSTAKALEDVLCERVQSQSSVVVDLGAVQYVSSAGLRVLLRSAKIAKASSHTLVLAGLAPAVQEVFDISGFSSIFTIRPDVASATAAT